MDIQFIWHHLLQDHYFYFILVTLYEFPEAALAKYHDCAACNNRNSLPHSSGD